jgi:hypothetical protein
MDLGTCLMSHPPLHFSQYNPGYADWKSLSLVLKLMQVPFKMYS